MSGGLVGLVLAGGRSTRFGSEKAAALFEGRPLLAHACAALQPLCETVAVSARAGSETERLAAGLGHPVLHDAAGAPEGPLAGVAAGVAWAQALGAMRLAIMPCDTPRVGTEVLFRLAAALDADHGAAVARTPDGLQALVAVIRLDRAAPLSEAVAAGRHPAMREIWSAMGARELAFEDAGTFRNLNRPEDLTPDSR